MISPDIWILGLAYLLGSIPVGWLIANIFYHKDIRQEGSGNIGATNALRIFG
ncbi:MAG TPA: glycerol-3-phosphate acyltransferase, partial [Candidatus Cloacimonadota bacterium]|nr:glycerol-3-phosphate acyltransferase [Candidatus Cloacimonadota bacterium]